VRVTAIGHRIRNLLCGGTCSSTRKAIEWSALADTPEFRNALTSR
jgi:hypothetical protein